MFQKLLRGACNSSHTMQAATIRESMISTRFFQREKIACELVRQQKSHRLKLADVFVHAESENALLRSTVTRHQDKFSA